mgnify:CR=1 FL=1
MEKSLETAARNVALLQQVVEACINGGHQPDPSTIEGLIRAQKELFLAEKELFSQIAKKQEAY